MNVLKRIKQFFKNMGYKQKLLESPKETGKENVTMKSSNEKDSKFLEELKFDPKDLLDPRVCNGKDLVPNILRTLGANEDVINNPQLIEEIGVHFQGIANQSGIEMPNYYEQPTRENINAIVEAVKSNGILTSKDIYNKYANLGLKGHEIYDGISIDQETGDVTLQRLTMSGRESNAFDGNNMNVKTFSSDGKGKAIADTSFYKIDEDTLSKNLSHTSEILYNPDGIEMRVEHKSYRQENGQDVLEYHSVNTRDEQYPFIAKEETIVNEGEFGSPVGTKYMAIEMKDLAQVSSPEYQKDENGRNTTTPITFDDRTQISQYYQDNKETIDNALMQEPNHGIFSSKNLKQSLKTGIKNLAVKAGILPNEHEKETELAD